MATRDIPVDTFGDVNGSPDVDDDEDGDDGQYLHLPYYNNDAAQTIFPFLDHWKLQQDDGSLVGIVYNHPTYTDGEAIGTSPLDEEISDHPVVEGIVTTITGSQYLLGNELVVAIRDWRLTSEGALQGIVSYSYPHVDLKEGQKITTSPTLRNKGKVEEGVVITTESGSHYHLLQPLVFPLLEQWKRLEGGSIAGYVYHHKKIADGELITTTPLTELDESQEGLILVTTASGSQYQLGEAEPMKHFTAAAEEDYVIDIEATEEEEAAEVQDVFYGYEDENDQDEDEEEYDIPTYHIPLQPKINPLEQIFTAAFQQHQKIVENNNKNRHKQEDQVVLPDGSSSMDVVEKNNTSWSNQTVWGH